MSTTPETQLHSSAADDAWQKLIARLFPLHDILSKQGSLASRRAGKQRVWTVRYYDRPDGGRKVQRTIYVGSDPQLVRRVQRLLLQWRLIAELATRGDKEAQAFAGQVRQAVRQYRCAQTENQAASP